MKLSQFKFKLPEELIALYPHSIYREFENDNGEKETFRITRRDECRLMVLHKKSQTIEMYKKDDKGNPIEGEYLDFRNVLDYFGEHDTFIFNDTKVFPARLWHKGEDRRKDRGVPAARTQRRNASVGRARRTGSQDTYRQQAVLRRFGHNSG